MENTILGHQNIITQLQSAVASERVAGAYLFSGVQGVGKETVALYFANLILCEQRTEDNTPCGECRACRKIKNGNHPDLQIIRPDGAQIKIDQVRELQREIVYQPFEGPRKIYILANTERMHNAAANALLKTLEEPPAASTLILLTENIESILLTIRSRCQVLPFYPMSAEELTAALIEQFSVDEETAYGAAVLAGGVVGKALTLIQKGITESQTVPEILKETSPLAAFRLAEQLEKNLDSLDELITWYRDLLFLQQGAPMELITHPNAIEELKALVPRYSRIRIQQAIKNVLQTKELLKSTNVTKILSLEVMCLKLLQSQ